MAECKGIEVEYTADSMRPYAEFCYDDLCEILNEAHAG